MAILADTITRDGLGGHAPSSGGGYTLRVKKDGTKVLAKSEEGRTVAQGRAGTDDGSVFETALEWIASTYGRGTLSVKGSPAAPYQIDRTLHPHDFVVMRGEDDASILQRTTNAVLIALDQYVNDASFIQDSSHILNLLLDGGAFAATVADLRNVKNTTLRDLKIRNFAGDGVVMRRGTNPANFGCFWNRIQGGRYDSIVSSTGAGIATADGCKDSWIDNIVVQGPADLSLQTGIRVENTTNMWIQRNWINRVVNDVYVHTNGGGVEGIKLTHNVFDNSSQHKLLIDADTGNIDGVYAEFNEFIGTGFSAPNTWDLIHIRARTGRRVDFSDFRRNKCLTTPSEQAWNINYEAQGTGTFRKHRIHENDMRLAGLSGTFNLVEDPTNPFYRHSVRGNTSFASENYGMATFMGDGVTTAFNIAHGLARTPRRFNVLPITQAAGDPDRSVSAGSANLTVSFAAAPPNGFNVNFQWEAEYSA